MCPHQYHTDHADVEPYHPRFVFAGNGFDVFKEKIIWLRKDTGIVSDNIYNYTNLIPESQHCSISLGAIKVGCLGG